MNTESGIPVTGLYADEAPSGYIEPPTNTQFHSGVEPEMTLPAAWWNYFVNLFTNTNIKAKEDITAILTELNNALTGGGVTPDPEAANQLLTLLQKGSGSTVNADKVRDTTPGTRGLQYLAAAAVSNIATLILADLKTVDGSGSGLDADTVDGVDFVNGAAGVYGVFTVAKDSALVIPKGLYMLATTAVGGGEVGDGAHLQINYNNSWLGQATCAGLVLSDGINYRLRNPSDTYDTLVRYRKLT